MRGLLVALALSALCLSVGKLAAEPAKDAGSDIDSEHLFGFTEGTDIGRKGDRELELEGSGRLGKRSGTYNVFGAGVEAKLSLTDSFRIAPGAHVSYHHISGVPGLDDRSAGGFEGMTFEMKYRVLDRALAGVGLTFGVTPNWSRIDETSGARANAYGVDFLASADKELIAGKLFGAVNVRYEPGATYVRGSGEWSRDSALHLSVALALQIYPGVFVGGELRHLRAYEGLALESLVGNAWFAGPTFYAKIAEGAWMAVVWSAQFAGHAPADTGHLDLVNFERHEFKIRLGLEF